MSTMSVRLLHQPFQKFSNALTKFDRCVSIHGISSIKITFEVLYLDCRRGLVLSYKCEIVFILEEFIYKICLADTATTTYDDKFRTV